MRTAIYPGTFDPVTLGHVDLVERGRRLFDRVIVAVADSTSKGPLFTPSERADMFAQAVTHLDHVEVVLFDHLTVQFARERGACAIIRGLRAAMISVMESDYISTARSVGVAGGRLVRRFVLRNAAGPGVTLLAIEIGYLLFGAVVIETTFALPGVGQGLVIAAQGRDLPSVQGYTLLFALVVVAVYLLSDVVTAMLDPRVEIDT